MKGRMLVTGGTGFVGKYLVESLSKKGYKLVVLSRNPGKIRSVKKSSVKLVRCNLLDKRDVIKACYNASLIIHLAGDMSNKGDINREGMKNLISAAKENGILKIIYVSTINVRQKYKDIYARSKLDAERILQKSGINHIILRPTVVYDLRANTSLKLFVKLAKNLPVIPSLPRNSTRMQPIFVDDLVRIICLLLKENKYWKKKKKVFEAGGSDTVSMQEILRLFVKKLRLKRIILPIPLPVMKICAILLSIVGKRERVLGMLEDKITVFSVKDSFGFRAKGFHENIKHMKI